MTGNAQSDRSARRPHLSTIALVVALLAALASVSRTFAHDAAKEDREE